MVQEPFSHSPHDDEVPPPASFQQDIPRGGALQANPHEEPRPPSVSEPRSEIYNLLSLLPENQRAQYLTEYYLFMSKQEEERTKQAEIATALKIAMERTKQEEERTKQEKIIAEKEEKMKLEDTRQLELKMEMKECRYGKFKLYLKIFSYICFPCIKIFYD